MTEAEGTGYEVLCAVLGLRLCSLAGCMRTCGQSQGFVSLYVCPSQNELLELGSCALAILFLPAFPLEEEGDAHISS